MITVVACPACQQNLQVPPDQVGQQVRCPGCEHVFTASDTSVRAATPSAPAAPAMPPSLPADNVPAWERPPEDDLARPLDEDEAADMEADADEAERRQRRRDKKDRKAQRDSDSGYYGELKRKQRKTQNEHRGPLVLILAILSIVFSPCSLLAIGACACGYYAYQIGSHDLQEIYAGRMDKSGETMAKIGRIMGIIGICLSMPMILLNLCGLVVVLIRAAVGPV